MNTKRSWWVVALALGCSARGTTGVSNPFEDVPSASGDSPMVSGDSGTPPVDIVLPGVDRPQVTLPDGGTDPCAAATNCGECTAGSTCGWCDGQCRTGTGSGPASGACVESTWAWTSSQCTGTPPPRDAGPTLDVQVTPACQSCTQSMCGEQLSGCLADRACLACLMAPNAGCIEVTAFSAVLECACSSCSSTCGALCGG